MPARALPYLNHRRGIAKETFTGRRQSCAGLVPNKESAIEQILQTRSASSRARGRRRHAGSKERLPAIEGAQASGSSFASTPIAATRNRSSSM
jgi:hypothetical protein